MIKPIGKRQRLRAHGFGDAGVIAAIMLLAATACRAEQGQPKAMEVAAPPKMTDVNEAADEVAVTFDHARFDRVLRKFVDRDGWVDYARLANDPADLDAYIADLKSAPIDSLARNDRLALLINAYNAFTLRLILDFWDGGQLESIQDIPEGKRWDDKRWNIGGKIWSLNQIEHERIRGKFEEPRIHFALVCAAVGCPPLRPDVYQGDRLDSQLEAQSEYVHNHATWFRYDESENAVHLTKLYEWYGEDFHEEDGTVLEFVARYSDSLGSVIEQGKRPRIEWLPYDWSLNSRANKQSR